MGRKIPWLDMASKKERARREEKLRRRLFPLGAPQREAELRLLRALVTTRAQDEDLLYQLVQARDCLYRQEDEEPAEQRERLQTWLQSQLLQRYTRQERLYFLALAQCGQVPQTLDDLPDAAAVRRRAEALQNGDAPLLP